MKTQKQVENFIETLGILIPKLKVKQAEYLEQGNEFGYNIMKERVKERMIELNTARWFLDDNTDDKEET